MSELTTLGLKLPTDPRWADLAAVSLEDILTDHAYCEQKAASSGISLIQSYPDKDFLVDSLAPIVVEEWGHFRMVLHEIRKRGLTLGRQRKDLYVNGLRNFLQLSGDRDKNLLERLLMFALIEARSCERFKRLSEELEDPYFKDFYRKFMISEAGHYRLFLDIAMTYHDEKVVRDRFQEWLDFEKELMPTLEVRGDRMH